LAKAVSIIPKSIKIWVAACEQEKDKETRKRILKRALEHIPNSL
jgi:pre-mRNA-processing factor 6